MKTTSQNKIPCDKVLDEVGGKLDSGKYNSALKILLDNLDRCTDNARYHAYIGFAYFHLGRYQKAIKFFDKALELEPCASNTLFLRARCKDELDMTEDAKVDYRLVLKLDPKAKDAHFYLGLLEDMDNNITEAIKLFEQALEIDPKDQEAREMLAILKKSP